MKKLVLFTIAILAISFASCSGNKAQQEVEAAKAKADSIEAAAQKAAAEIEAAGDSIIQATDSLINEAIEE